MRVCELRGAFGLENLVSAERATPEPGAREVLVRIEAASLNYRDLLTARGEYNPKQKLPLIPCSDGAGVVERVGEGVTRWKAGDRVAGRHHVVNRPVGLDLAGVGGAVRRR